MQQPRLQTCYIETPLGHAKISGNEDGIVSISIIDTLEDLTNPIPEPLLDGVTQLKEYFYGNRSVFNLKLNPKGTIFQKKVWNALANIPFGKTISYLQLSKQLGDTKAIRAVASANGKNPLWIIIPCHRVIGSDGSLTGYAGGLYRKQWLLNHESEHKQQSLF
ncbi:methylated-DNA--[protein]-cysteine S-methyltransferase [Winogradskyella sediminis]|uniref:Methylated-DNA--protein-cysteine methyltransferase n=1 Tax=Winogradskyella sediminis TaxID=1382466 RepID=A0A1H1SGA8_9FLAO|nr:methylated-DNA--[protein]-cysteine S-methyltransferase [Winogradskyella sediminis]SDS46419.1 methylated-DNA-[protein]-cysteine S-methyltransferase [Winogradskyella sediminis]